MRFALYLVSAVSLCAQVPDLTLADQQRIVAALTANACQG